MNGNVVKIVMGEPVSQPLRPWRIQGEWRVRWVAAVATTILTRRRDAAFRPTIPARGPLAAAPRRQWREFADL